MKRIICLSICLLLFSCFQKVPQKRDYLGVYRIIKIEEAGETIVASRNLNQIEIQEDLYISSMDRNNDNRFSADEVHKDTYTFSVNDNNIPQIQITGNPFLIELHPHNYYDLLMIRYNDDITTSLYLNKAR